MTEHDIPQQTSEESGLFPSGPFSPLHFGRLPERYVIIATDQQMDSMKAYGTRLKTKHPSWKTDRFMRKVFEKFPAVKIKIP